MYRQPYMQLYRQPYMHAYMQPYIQPAIHACIHVTKQAAILAAIHTNIQADIHAAIRPIHEAIKSMANGMHLRRLNIACRLYIHCSYYVKKNCPVTNIIH